MQVRCWMTLALICVCAAYGACQLSGHPTPQREQAAQLNRKGAASVQANLLDQAKAEFQQAIQLDPSLADAYENLALLLMLEGDDEMAEKTARHLLTIAPDNYNARLVAGVAAINRKEYRRGLEVLTPLSRSAESDPIVTAAESVALEQNGRHAEAVLMSKRLDHAGVADQDTVLAGQIFRETHLQMQAQRWLDALVQREPDVAPEKLYLLAEIYVQEGNTADASNLLTRILVADPNNIDALVELSDIELARGDHESSLAHLNKARGLSTQDVRSLIHLSRAYIRRRMYVYASEVLQRVVALDAYNRDAWYQLGLAQFKLDQTDAAEKDFRAALQLDPHDEWSRVGLGALLVGAGRQDEARSEFKHALTDYPQCGAAYYYLGEDEVRRGDTAAARRDLTKAVSYANGDARPLTALAELQMDADEFDAARISLDKAIALDPASAAAHYQRASLFRRQKKPEEAKQEIALFRKYEQQEKENRIVGIANAPR
jgi:tetratricopeptide (TPR) repeat protein